MDSWHDANYNRWGCSSEVFRNLEPSSDIAIFASNLVWSSDSNCESKCLFQGRLSFSAGLPDGATFANVFGNSFPCKNLAVL